MNDVNRKKINFSSGYSPVNGLEMYHEVYGEGQPLVLVHGGGSTIQSTFEQVIPLLAQKRKVIGVEMQAHGRTTDREADLSFEQDADDLAVFLYNLNLNKADCFGFSNGGTTVLQLAIRHPQCVNKIILGSALAKRNGVPDEFWTFMNQARLDNMPEPLKQAYLNVAPDPSGLQIMHDRDAKRMVNFEDIPDGKIQSVKASTLIISGDKDIITPEHSVFLHRLITDSRLAILPGGHGAYIGEVTTPTDKNLIAATASMIDQFLQDSEVNRIGQ